MAGVAEASSPAIKVAALYGSLRKGSFHRSFIYFAIELSNMEIEYIDISPLPMLNTELESDGTYPSEVEDFHRKILAADGVLFASPGSRGFFSLRLVLFASSMVFLSSFFSPGKTKQQG